jgi:hypothetical protein
LTRFEFKSGTVLFYFFLSLSHSENRVYLSRGVGNRCDKTCSDEDRGRSRRPGAEHRNGRTGRVLSGRVIERSGDAMCGLHRARGDEERGFLS